MTVSAYNLINGIVFDQEAARMLKGVCINNVYIYTNKTTGYVYWTAGNLILNATSYALTAGNSGASQTDKLIIATFTDGANTVAISFITTATTIPEGNKMILGYVDGSSRLTLFNGSAQPNLSGYTLVKATANINVNGEGYFLSAFASAFAHRSYSDSAPVNPGTASASISITVNVDGITIITETDSDTSSASSTGDMSICASASSSVSNVYKFNSNLTITFSNSATTSGGDTIKSDHTKTKAVIFYLIK